MLSFIFGKAAAKEPKQPKQPKPLRPAFARAAAKPGASSNEFADVVLQQRPDLADETVYFAEQGIYGHTAFIGDEVFKGPRASYAIESIDHEVEVLQKLEGSDLPVPHVTCVGKDFVFYGMTRMPGVMPGIDLEKTLTPDQQRQLAKDMIDFVMGMAKATATEDGKFMVHNDMHYENVLIDPETKRLTAVIDFGITATIARDQWYPAAAYYSLPSFKKMLEEEYKQRKDELPDPELATRKAIAAAKGMNNA